MASRKYNPHLATLPGRHWAYRAMLLTLVTFAMALLVMGKSGNPAIAKLRTGITDALMPVLAAAASPFDVVHEGGAWVSEIIHMRAENVRLKNQNLQLLKWQAAAKSMAEENEALRGLLNVLPAKQHNYVTARVVSDLGGPYVHSALIAGGSGAGIEKDRAVISEHGLVGRVIDVGERSARVLLLSDINSRVPVITEGSREKSILVGDNKELLTLSYLASGSRIEEGERLVTSGDGGIFPPGIPVGVVTSVENGAVLVQPFVNPTRVEYVSIIDGSL